jgi:predicted Na+-dependent transporter
VVKISPRTASQHIVEMTAKNNRMNQLKRMAGIIWMLLGPVAVYYLIQTASSEIAKKPVIDTKIQWGVFVIVFIPIAFGMVLFGWYAFKGEYDHLPERSEELID